MKATATPDHLLELADGRHLAANSYGDPEGRPVLLLPSAPGSRCFDPDSSVTLEAGIHLIVTDRPGYGASTPHTGVPTWSQVAADHVALLAALGISDVQVVGWSNGGLGALSLAASSDLISSIALIGTPAPDDEVPWIPDAFRGFLAPLRDSPQSAVAALAPSFQPMLDDPAAAVSAVAQGEADDRVIETHRATLENMMREAFRSGALGVASDIVATNVAPLDINYDDVRVPVALLYGVDDPIVTPAHGRFYQSALDTGQLDELDETGHLAIISHWAQVLGI